MATHAVAWAEQVAQHLGNPIDRVRVRGVLGALDHDLPLDQLDMVKRLLGEKSVRYWVSEHAISMDGGPYIAVVNFGRGGNLDTIQSILDSVP